MGIKKRERSSMRAMCRLWLNDRKTAIDSVQMSGFNKSADRGKQRALVWPCVEESRA